MTVTSLVGMLESHSSPHRFIVSSYLRLRDGDWGSPRYQLADQFMTVRFYDLEQKPDIIAAERKMIRSRLQQAVAAFPRWYRRKI